MDTLVAVRAVGLFVVLLWSCREAYAVAESLAPQPWRARCHPRPSQTRCPFCHDDLAHHTHLVSCGRCSTVHHSGCWDDHPGCSVYGCGR